MWQHSCKQAKICVRFVQNRAIRGRVPLFSCLGATILGPVLLFEVFSRASSIVPFQQALDPFVSINTHSNKGPGRFREKGLAKYRTGTSYDVQEREPSVLLEFQ